jgi:hypothetical protein
MNIRPMRRERREQWTRRLLSLQVHSNDLVKLGDFRQAQKALRISRRAYDHWGRECFKRPEPAPLTPPAPPSIATCRELANAFRR